MSKIEELEKAKQLLDDGSISEEEFAKVKADILCETKETMTQPETKPEEQSKSKTKQKGTIFPQEWITVYCILTLVLAIGSFWMPFISILAVGLGLFSMNHIENKTFENIAGVATAIAVISLAGSIFQIVTSL